MKAAMGGGGKGMRVVREMKDLVPFFESATSEAEAALGDDPNPNPNPSPSPNPNPNPTPNPTPNPNPTPTPNPNPHPNQAAFGDGSVFVERFVNRPRHIEIQAISPRSPLNLP